MSFSIFGQAQPTQHCGNLRPAPAFLGFFGGGRTAGTSRSPRSHSGHGDVDAVDDVACIAVHRVFWCLVQFSESSVAMWAHLWSGG